MTQYTLTLVDVRRIQNYLFNANELKQCLGGSTLVELATHQWIVDALPPKKNVALAGHTVTFSAETIADLDAEAIFLGGGNAAILFRSPDLAVDFAQKYTRQVLVDAPGLEVAVAHVDVEWDKEKGLLDAWNEMQTNAMPKQKEGRAVSQPLLGLGVTAECAFTGLPAVEKIPDPDNVERDVLVSAEAFAKNNAGIVTDAKERLAESLPLKSYAYPDRFDDLGGEKGRSSFIAVVHADGNSMGKRIQAYCSDNDNLAMLNKMRKFSEALNDVSVIAMAKTVTWLEGTIHGGMIFDKWYENEFITLQGDKFPLRPILFGGDDLAFVSEGRLGLVLTEKYLEELAKIKLPDGLPVFACAGVAIVPRHYPFSRAYHLAEELTREAKKQARESDKDLAAVSLIHWYVATSGLTRDWEEIKQREFKGGKLLLRPLVVKHNPQVQVDQWRTWDVFVNQVDYFRNPKQDKTKWKFGRGKLKELREIVRNGENSVKEFTIQNGDLPVFGVSDLGEARKTGWYGDRCIYFDSLEADDFFISPKEAKNE